MSSQVLMEPLSIDELLLELALAIEEYPKTIEQEKDEKARAILEIADNLDQSTHYGQKQEPKNALTDLLGYKTNGYKVRSTFHTISSAIVYLTDIGVKDIGKVVARLPHVLELDVEKTMKPRVKYLRSIGVRDEDIGKVVARLPHVLELDVENNLKPTYEFLKDKFGATTDILVKTPAFLGYSLNRRIKPRHAFLESEGLINGSYANINLLILSDERFCRQLNVPLQEYLGFKETYLQQHKAKD